jgi:hypothetical protein
MRDFKGMKRQRGRNRGGGGGGGGKPQHNSNRAFDSNGPEGIKVRGAAQHVYEKYQQLARDAHTAGDRVIAENYLQHAEHYFRVMRAMQPTRPVSEIIGRDQFASGYDIDFEDESGVAQGVENGADVGEGERPREEFRNGELQRDDRPREERWGSDRQQGDRSQGDRSQGDRYDGRGNERGQGEPFAGERNGGDRGQRNFRDDRPRYRDDRGQRSEGRDFRESAPAPVLEAERPPAPVAPAPSDPLLRADDGEVNHAPAFLQVRPQEPRQDGESRRRRRKPAAGFEPAGVADEADEG